MQAWQEKASAQDFVLQMVMERIFYSSDGPLSGQTILWLGADSSRDPWLRGSRPWLRLFPPRCPQTRGTIFCASCAESIQLVRVGGEIEKNGHDLLSVSHS